MNTWPARAATTARALTSTRTPILAHLSDPRLRFAASHFPDRESRRSFSSASAHREPLHVLVHEQRRHTSRATSGPRGRRATLLVLVVVISSLHIDNLIRRHVPRFPTAAKRGSRDRDPSRIFAAYSSRVANISPTSRIFLFSTRIILLPFLLSSSLFLRLFSLENERLRCARASTSWKTSAHDSNNPRLPSSASRSDPGEQVGK